MADKTTRSSHANVAQNLVDVQIQVILNPKAKKDGYIVQHLRSVNPKAKISALKRKIEKDIGILQEIYSLSYLDTCPLDDNSTLKDHFFVSGSQLRLQPWDMWQDLLHYTFKGDINLTLTCMHITGLTDWNRYCAWVALYIASHRGYHDLVARLLKAVHSLQVNMQSRATGWTALHAAARMGHWKTLCILLNNGSNVRIKDFNKLSAFDLARENGHKKCENSLNFCQWNLQKHYIVQERSQDYDAHKARRSAYRQTHLHTDSTITPLLRGPRGQIYTASTPNTVTIKQVKKFDKTKGTERGDKVTDVASADHVTNKQSCSATSDVEKFEFNYGWFDETRARQLIPATDELLTYLSPSANELHPKSLLNPKGFSLPSVKFSPPKKDINQIRYVNMSK